jgi:cobalt-zinc-cadmium efflux system outer membrane protein
LRAGDTSELEVSAPRVEALLATEASRRLAQDLRLARERLGVLLGAGITIEHLTVAAAPSGGELEAGLPGLMEIALAARPDLRAAELGIEAARERAGLARWEVVSVAGIADANGKGSQGFEIGPGLEMTVPVFNRNQAGKARADADLDRAVLRRVTVEQRVAADVCEAHIRFIKAEEQAAMWRGRVVPELEDGVRRAERAYAAGDVSLLLLEQTAAQLIKVRAQAAEADADIARARAELERSVGRRLEPGEAAP